MSLQARKWNIEQCNRCNQCKISPVPKSQRFSAVCPAVEYGQFHAYSGSGKIITGYAISTGWAKYSKEVVDSLTTCTMCGACDTACHHLNGDLIQPIETLYDVRAQLASDGQLPAAHRLLLDHLAKHGNPYGRPREERSRWAQALNLVDATREPVEVLLHIGCSNAFDKNAWPMLSWIAAALGKAEVRFGTLGNQECNTGVLAYELGDRELAATLARQTIELVKRSGAKTLVTCCADSIAAFRNFYPRMELPLKGIEVLHITEYLQRLMASGQCSLKATAQETVTYHDPCKLGRLSEPFVPWSGTWKVINNGLRFAEPPRPKRFGLGGIYDAPRQLLQQVQGTRLVEMERIRELSYCCGAGGGGKEAHPEFAEKAAADRLAEAISTGASTLVTACASCTSHLRQTAERQGLHIQVKNLVEYLMEAMP